MTAALNFLADTSLAFLLPYSFRSSGYAAETSRLETTTSAGSRSPEASVTPETLPSALLIDATSAPNRKLAPQAPAASSSPLTTYSMTCDAALEV